MKTHLQRNLALLLFVCLSLTVRSQNDSCLIFDGTDDYLVAENFALNDIETNDFTFEAWVKGDESVQVEHPPIFSNRPDEVSGTVFFFHGIWNGSMSKMLAVQLDGANYFVFNNGTLLGASMLDNVCHHVAITRNIDLLSFYFDGDLIGTRTITNGNPTVASGNSLYIGLDPPISAAFEGNLSQVRIWNYARSLAEIQAAMNVSIVPSSGLRGYWEMNDGFGEIVVDKAGIANAQRGSTTTTDINDPSWSENCCQFLGIQNENTPKLRIFPNPTKKSLFIDLQVNYLDIIIAIVDVNGRILDVRKFYNEARIEMDIESLSEGIYFVQITADGKKMVSKIIKE